MHRFRPWRIIAGSEDKWKHAYILSERTRYTKHKHARTTDKGLRLRWRNIQSNPLINKENRGIHEGVGRRFNPDQRLQNKKLIRITHATR